MGKRGFMFILYPMAKWLRFLCHSTMLSIVAMANAKESSDGCCALNAENHAQKACRKSAESLRKVCGKCLSAAESLRKVCGKPAESLQKVCRNSRLSAKKGTFCKLCGPPLPRGRAVAGG